MVSKKSCPFARPPPPIGPASTCVTPGRANGEARYCEVGRARARSGRWVGIAAPPRLGHHSRGAAAPTDAREPSLALLTSSSSRTPETLARLGSRPRLRAPLPSLASHIVSASFSLLLEGKKKIHHHRPGAPSPSEKQNQT